MYVETPEVAKKFAAALKRKAHAHPGVEAWLAPSFTLVPVLGMALKRSAIKVGGQTLSAKGGAHTGEVSAAMLRAAGAHFVIVGHSEVRAAGVNNEGIRAQLVAADRAGLVPILCVGEQERDPQGAHFSVVQEQLSSALRQGPIAKLIVAYEPVWAIGKSAEYAMRPSEVEEMLIFIRKTLAEYLGRDAAHKALVLYGGSIEPENARSILEESGASGLLVGHASAEADLFLQILTACKK